MIVYGWKIKNHWGYILHDEAYEGSDEDGDSCIFYEKCSYLSYIFYIRFYSSCGKCYRSCSAF